MLICKRVHYRGNVQGVGFRFTTQAIARGFPVAGYVCNLSNGQVEVVAQGEESDVSAFLETLARRMERYIDGQDVTEMPSENFKNFTIRR